MDSDFDVALSRLTAWMRDYGTTKSPAFYGDLSLVLLAAKDYQKVVAERDEARRAAAEVTRDFVDDHNAAAFLLSSYDWLQEELEALAKATS